MKLTNIDDFKIGSSVQGFYLCQRKQLRHTQNDDLYMDLVFSDATGSIPGKMWDLVDDFQNCFERGDPVAVKGKVSEYNNMLQLTVNQINRATSKQYGQYGFAPKELIKKVDEPVVDLWKRLMKTTQTIKSPLKELITTILIKYKNKILTMPVSVNQHLPLSGGFLKHIVVTSEITRDILYHYTSLDSDLVLAGIILNNIGKVKSINDDLIPSHTNDGKLIGHMVLGRDIVLDAIRSMKNFPEDILAKLEHIILSNQVSTKQGDMTFEQFPEALFVNYIDDLDIRMNLMMDTIATDKNSHIKLLLNLK